MLMTQAQAYVLDLLQNLGGLSKAQLLRILYIRFHTTEKQMEVMLSQLRHCVNRVRLSEQRIWMEGIQTAPGIREAIDVMLEMTGGNFLSCTSKCPPPLVLRFVAGSEIHTRFDVLPLEKIEALENIPPIGAEITRIILLKPCTIRPTLSMHCPYYFAVLDGKGGHRFFKGVQSASVDK